ALAPAMQFNPLSPGFVYRSVFEGISFESHKGARRPGNAEDIAYMSIGQLAELVRTRQITSEELTTLYIERIRRLDPQLEAVITLMEDYALERARAADREIASG